MRSNVLSALLIGFLSLGCGPKGGVGEGEGLEGSSISSWFNSFLSRPSSVESCQALGKWLDKYGSGLVAKVERPGFEMELQYRPAACLACMENHDAVFADSTFQERVGQLKATELYVLKIYSGKSASDSSHFELSEHLAKDLVEVVGMDTFPCAFFHVEALPSLVPYRSALIGFERPQDGRVRRVIFKDTQDHFGGDLIMDLPANGLSRYAEAVPDTLPPERS